MTAVCLKAKNSVLINTWSDIFTALNTYTKSCLFVQQLTRTCISTILYLRKVLPDDYFETTNFEGITLKLLKARKGEDYVSKIEQWLEGAFEAIEKKYLKRLMLDINDADSNLTLEIYTITFNYNREKETLNSLLSANASINSDFTVSNIKLSVIKLLQMCHAVTQTYGSLPSHIKLSMRLSYYENTPEDYQPCGYISEEPIDPEFPKHARSIEIGSTGTQYHFFKLLNKSCLNDKFLEEMKSHLENGSSVALSDHTHKLVNILQERKTTTKRELRSENFKQSSGTGIAQLDWNFEFLSKIEGETKFIVTEKNSLISNKDPKELLNSKTCKSVRPTRTVYNRAVKKFSIKEDFKVRCACLSNDKSETMFSCVGCNFLVHAECFGILEFDCSKKVRFYCHLCHQTENNFKCHDKVIVSLKNAGDQQKLSILRRVLRQCTLPNVSKITLKKIEKIASASRIKKVANAVLNKMIEIGVAVPQGKRKNYLIDKLELSNKLVHYFYKIQNSPQSPGQEQFRKQKQLQIKQTFGKTSKNFNRKKEDEFLTNTKSKKSNDIPHDYFICNDQTSQQSCDIFF